MKSPMVEAQDHSSPYPPSNPYPEDHSQRNLTDVTLSWTCNDPDGDPLTYDVYFGLVHMSFDPPLIESGLTDNSLDISGLEYGSRYMWHVTAEDADGHRTDGPLWIFDTISEDPGEDLVYAELTVHRSQTSSGTEITRIDYVSARFDSLYAPEGPINPLRPESVSVNIQGGPLEWDDSRSWYYYANTFNGWFLAPGAEYVFSITGGDGVPSLVTDPIVMPECGPYITSPEPFSSVTLEGLEVVWTGHDTYPDCDRPVTIRIKDMGPIEWTDVFITTENDGSYTFTASDVSGIDPFGYQFQITLIVDNKELIDAPGYDPRSWIWARTYATQFVFTN